MALASKTKCTRPINLLYPLELEEKKSEAAVMRSSLSKRSVLLTSLVILLLLIPPTTANQCQPDKNATSLKRIWSSKCVTGGYVVLESDVNTLCWKRVNCIKGHLDGKGNCQKRCQCPSWAIQCTHVTASDVKSQMSSEETTKVLEAAKPTEICSFSPAEECNSEPVHEKLPVIQLLNGSKIIVESLNIKWTQHVGDDYECIGQGKQSGTEDFCRLHQCVSDATKFYKYAENELLFYFNSEGQIPIQAYGEVTTKVYYRKPPAELPLHCTNCQLTCQKGGVEINMDGNINFMEVCSSPVCYKVSFPKRRETALFPVEINMVDHEVNVKLWAKGYLVKELGTECAAAPFCEMIQCYICWTRLANPQCSSNYWLVLLFAGIYFFSLTLYMVLRILRMLGKFTIFLARLLIAIGRLCCKLCRKAKNTTYRKALLPIYTLVEQDEPQGEVDTDTRLPSSISAPVPRPADLQGAPGVRVGQRNYRLQLPYLAATVVFACLLRPSNGCAEVTTMTAQQSVCTVQKTGVTECVFTEVSRIALAPQGQDACLLLKDPHGEPLGTLSVEVRKLTLSCQPRNEYYTRSYDMKHRAVKRCATAGSCNSPNKCGDVKIDSKIDELKGEANDNPGYMYCAESCGDWNCGCFWATYACFYYRTYALAKSDVIYEVFSCPAWRYKLSAKVRLMWNGKAETHEFTLLPGIQSKWKNVKLLLVAVTHPPAPLRTQPVSSDRWQSDSDHWSVCSQPARSGHCGLSAVWFTVSRPQFRLRHTQICLPVPATGYCCFLHLHARLTGKAVQPAGESTTTGNAKPLPFWSWQEH